MFSDSTGFVDLDGWASRYLPDYAQPIWNVYSVEGDELRYSGLTRKQAESYTLSKLLDASGNVLAESESTDDLEQVKQS